MTDPRKWVGWPVTFIACPEGIPNGIAYLDCTRKFKYIIWVKRRYTTSTCHPVDDAECLPMYKYVLAILFWSLNNQTSAQDVSEVQVIDFDNFKPYLDKDSDTTFVINFWATWCAPCVAELPHFERLNATSQGSPVKVVLVSLDFKNQLQSKLIPFIREHAVKSKVVFLDAPNPNDWIDLVDPSWSGALPATLIYKQDTRQFFEQSFEDYESLESIVHTFYKI